MILRNKQTGKVERMWKDNICLAFGDRNEIYHSLAELNERWEDYKPKDPYISDEATAKFVRAWAKHWGFEMVTAHTYTGSVELVGWAEPSTRGCEIDILGGFVSGALEEGKDYTIDELCGEEEE